jgi:peptide/nickel transport system permease protein
MTADTSTPKGPGAGRGLVRILRNPLVVNGSTITFLVLVLLAIFAPFLTPYDPVKVDLTAISLPPSPEHWFGTDTRGMDIFTRVLYGARIDLSLAITGIVFSMAAGLVFGSAAGYFGGFIDEAISRLAEMVQSIPMFLFAFIIVAALGSGGSTLLVVIALIYWPPFFKVTRSIAAPLMRTDYVAVAQTAGRSGMGIVLGHIAPNSFLPVLSQAAVNIGFAIQVIAGLSFLGLGIPIPQPEWGAMISVGAPRIAFGEWWMAVFPGLALLITVIALDGMSRRLAKAGNY